MNRIFDEIFEYVKELEIIDTHEHLPHCEDAREKNTDILKEYLVQYFKCDLITAGLSANDFKKVTNPDIPLTERWKIAEPYWEATRHTGYGRCLDISVNAIYGCKKICGSTIEQFNHEFLKSYKPGHFKKVLKEKSKIKISLLDNLSNDLECDKTYFRSVYRMDNLISPKTGKDILKIESIAGIPIHSFSDWLAACGIILDKAVKSGIVALKSCMAYRRTLKFDSVKTDDAKEEFNTFFPSSRFIEPEKSLTVGKVFQDYMMHYILVLASKYNLTYQIHTGYQEGNGNIISHSDPSLLSNLFLEYPDVNFDILHIGYPYQHVTSALAKTFPNVYMDMSFAHIISPNASVNTLIEWFDTVPLNKINAFGGDYCFVDGVYGHQYFARVNVCKALAKEVEEGIIDVDEAKEISRMFFFKNPLKLFKLQEILNN